MSTMECKKCTKQVVESERIFCRGFCGSAFHLICANVDFPVLEILGEHERNIFWMCTACADLFSNKHFRNITFRDGSERSDLPDTMLSMQADIAKLSSTIDMLAAKVENNLPPARSLALTATSWQNRQNTPVNTPKRRRVENLNPIGTISNRGTKVATGNIQTIPMKDNQFWIYLSAFHPDTSEDDIRALVRDCLGLSADVNPSVVKLVPKGKDLSLLRFVSFKIGVALELKDSALSSDSWPENVYFREFEDYRSKNVAQIVGINMNANVVNLNST